ncbi:MAG: NifB/NifX family molybdenum-iron cluster-binding protein [Marinifilaceae bacterium]
MKKIAVPTVQGILCPHFGHCESFRIYEVEENSIVNVEEIKAPPHQPGLLPKWLAEKGADEVIAGGMGQRAINLFESNQIKVTVGAAAKDPKEVVEEYLNGTLQVQANACDH